MTSTAANPSSPVTRSASRVRLLTARDLNVEDAAPSAADRTTTASPIESAEEEVSSARSDERGFVENVKALLFQDGGVILSGPPGTSKSYMADLIALDIAGDESRVKFIQFHPSYQYEDFMEGYLPDPETGSFRLKARHFRKIVKKATSDPDHNYVLVIDEISRADPARVFGEALTYVEKTKRGKRFNLASGKPMAIPDNLYIIATMNPFDRGVEDVDAAFERRFPRVRMEPDEQQLRSFLTANEMAPDLIDGTVVFFRRIQTEAKTNPAAALGHAFFLDVTDVPSLISLWEHRLSFFIDRAFPLDAATRQTLEDVWNTQVVDRRERREPLSLPAETESPHEPAP